MNEIVVGVLIFLCLTATALAASAIKTKLPRHHRDEETHNLVRLVVGFFAVMTSLALGLMITSAKATFDNLDRNMHVLATEIIQLDRMLIHYGPQTKETRQYLLAYVQRALHHGWPNDDAEIEADQGAEGLLNNAGDSLSAITPADAHQITLLQDAREKYRRVVDLRWIVVEQADRAIPTPLIVILVAWLMLIFASFGFIAPQNAVAVTTLVVAAALIASSLYLILDFDVPTSGPIQISPAALERAAIELQRQ